MEREVVFVVIGVLVLVALGELAVHLGRLRARVRRLEHNATPPTAEQQRLATLEQAQARLALEVQSQARLAAAAQAHCVTEPRALRDELTTARVERSAAEIGERRAALRPPTLAPLAHPDLIGSEDIADEVAYPRLGPEEKTPPRRGREAVLVPVFQGHREGGAA